MRQIVTHREVMSLKGIRAAPSGGPDGDYFGRKMIVWGTFSRSFLRSCLFIFAPA